MGKRDYYEVLGVSRTASEKEIRRVYRKLAMEHHPDRTQGNKESEEKFKELSEAYAILTNDEKRSNYDQFGHAGVESGFSNFTGFGDIFGDIFEDFFGGATMGRGARARRGNDLGYDLDITLEEAYEGFEREISIPRLETCEDCSGSGVAPGSSRVTCPVCRGAGRLRQAQGLFSITRTCHRCGGMGTINENPCKTCKGEGRARNVKKFRINVPPGVDTGSRLRYRGEGEVGPHGGSGGDLYVIINVKEHELFGRDDDDLLCEVPISFPQAALGTDMEIPTLDGSVKLKIPAGTQTHKVFRLRNKGMPSLRRRGRGDLLAKVIVETPSKLNERQREMLEEFAKISGDDVHPLTKKFLDTLKGVFGA